MASFTAKKTKQSIEEPDAALLAECKRVDSTHAVEFVRPHFLEQGRSYVNVWRKDGRDCLERALAEILELEEVEEDRVALRFKVDLGKGRWVILAGTVHTELDHGGFAEEELFPRTLKLRWEREMKALGVPGEKVSTFQHGLPGSSLEQFPFERLVDPASCLNELGICTTRRLPMT